MTHPIDMPRNPRRCQDACEDLYLACVRKKANGCIESLRLCRESCLAEGK